MSTWTAAQKAAAEKSRALDTLRGCVAIVNHRYEADPFSGAGNCWCGRPETSSLHGGSWDVATGMWPHRD